MELKLINGHNQCVFSEEEEKDIVNLVSNGASVRSVMRKYNITKKPINRVLDKYGVDHSRANFNGFEYNFPDGIYSEEIEKEILELNSSIGLDNDLKRKYNVNHYYFDNPYTEDKLYTLGFLYADGYVDKDCRISLSLEERDGYILERINNNLSNEKPVEYIDYSNKHDFGYTYENQHNLTINSKKINTVLQNLGVYNKKSLILDFPKWLKPEWYPHFIRGVYDGDGSVYLNNYRGKRAVTVTITSTEQFCKALVDICAKYIGIKAHIYDASCHNGITKVFTLCGRNVTRKFLDWIYQDANIYLQRKYDRYIDYFDINNSTVE